MFMRRNPGDYDHLARVKEWSLSGDADEPREAANERAPHPRGGDRQASMPRPIRRRRPGCPPTPARARPTCWRSASSGCCSTAPIPAKILCLTFTKAAAANMANRIFDTLAQMDRSSTTPRSMRRSAATGVRDIGAKRRAQARRLFASALETPGGLKVQTIHGFCTRLLQQFPFEANVAARFRVLEETEQSQMLEDIRRDGAARRRAAAGQRRRARAGGDHPDRQRLRLPDWR